MRSRNSILAFLGLLVSASVGPPANTQPFEHRPDWRRERLPRIEAAPDPALVTVVPQKDGWTRVEGAPGAAVDGRARLVRVINLRTADEVAAPVRSDGSFAARLFSPPGSTLQINTNMMETGDLSPEIEQTFLTDGQIVLSDMSGPEREMVGGMFGGDMSSSPGTLFPVELDAEQSAEWVPFVKKIGPNLWYFGKARLSEKHVRHGDAVRLDIELHVVFESENVARGAFREPPVIEPGFHILFDKRGHQRPHNRLSISHLLTPTGLPIEAHNEMLAEQLPDGRRE